jgi:uncharacterized protein (DUF433 family)
MHNERIELNPRVCNGKPVIRGTRIPVTVIVAQLAGGISWKDILEAYPELHEDDIRAALHYASDAIEHTDFADASYG